MAEYIERERARHELTLFFRYDTDVAEDCDSLLCMLPAADVVPVRHGEWISLTECANAGVYCSVCHKKVYKEDYAWCNKKNKVRSNYCPNCGARMDGE
jgi:hypothetical protein